MKAIHFILIFTLVFSACSSLKQADKSFAAGDYSSAIHLYKKNLKDDDAYSYFRLAEAYRKSNQINKAEQYYKRAVEIGDVDERAYYQYAISLKTNHKPEEAKKVLRDYEEIAQDEVVLGWARRELENLDQLGHVKSKLNYFRVKNLEGLNTNFAEYSPVYNNGWLYFTSNRDGGKMYPGTGTPFTDIYRVKTRGANVQLETLQALDPIINDPEINEGSITMSQNGRTLIFAKANSGKSSGTDEVNLYFTRFRNGLWSNPRPVSVNGKDSWDSTPALSPDGTTLYFSSNREGGYGGLDLYVAKLDRRGRWVDVRNLGPDINSPGNELFPYVGGTGTLYFSSDGWAGFGGLDLFEASRSGGHITIENLGTPVNSPSDDFGLYLFNPSRGFFTSNRKGGKGDDDIYTFVNDDPDLKIVNYYLSGTTYSRNDEMDTVEVLANTKVLLLDDQDQLVDEAFTALDGKFKFRVFTEEHYYLVAQKESYFATRDEFSTKGKSIDRAMLKDMVTDVEFNKDITLSKIIMQKPIVLNNIYYDLDKANIKPEAALELDKLVTIMNDNPEISIELSSHTDARADHRYNMNLSQRRAQSAVNYIISQGIETKRLVPKGYGETKLVIEDAQTEEEHQVNRRTEFKVTKYDSHVNDDKNEDYDETDRFFIDSEDDFE